MGDHDDRHAHFLLNILHQFEDPGLDRHVQGCSRLVRDQNIRLAGKRHGDHDPLPHASGEFEGILLHAFFRFVDIDKVQHFHCPVPRLLLVAFRVEQDRFHQLVSDRIGRVKAGHGILENDRDLVAPDTFHHIFIGAHQLLPVTLDRTRDDPACRCQDLHDGISRHRFSGSGFSHNSENLSSLKIKRDTIYRTHLSCIREK